MSARVFSINDKLPSMFWQSAYRKNVWMRKVDFYTNVVPLEICQLWNESIIVSTDITYSALHTIQSICKSMFCHVCSTDWVLFILTYAFGKTTKFVQIILWFIYIQTFAIGRSCFLGLHIMISPIKTRLQSPGPMEVLQNLCCLIMPNWWRPLNGARNGKKIIWRQSNSQVSTTTKNIYIIAISVNDNKFSIRSQNITLNLT